MQLLYLQLLLRSSVHLGFHKNAQGPQPPVWGGGELKYSSLTSGFNHWQQLGLMVNRQTKRKMIDSRASLPRSLRSSWPRHTERENPPAFTSEQSSTESEHPVHVAVSSLLQPTSVIWSCLTHPSFLCTGVLSPLHLVSCSRGLASTLLWT